MFLSHLSLQNFRSYGKSEFSFDKNTVIIIGPNSSGKTNLIEAIFFLSLGKSFRGDKDPEALKFGEEIFRILAETDKAELEIVLTSDKRKYLVNGVSKKRIDFAGNIACVLFSPADLDIVVDSPGRRRDFLDSVLEQVDREYRSSLISYKKGLRQRNALLSATRESGIRNNREFEYWDSVLIENGGIITKKRERLIEFINSSQKELFDFAALYDKSVISKPRLLQYQEGELGAGVTLVGPHRDDMSFLMYPSTGSGQATTHDIKLFGSRGQQRLLILQLKLLELLFVEKALGERPVLLLDDIFSELDQEHIELVLEMTQSQQTIITTTHKEFIPSRFIKNASVIELGK